MQFISFSSGIIPIEVSSDLLETEVKRFFRVPKILERQND